MKRRHLTGSVWPGLLVIILVFAGVVLFFFKPGLFSGAPQPVSVANIKGKPINSPVKTEPASPPILADTPPAELATNTAPAVPATNDAIQVVSKSTNAAAAASAEASAPPLEDGYFVIGFDKLASFQYETDDTQTNSVAKPEIPPKIREFNDKPIALRGFMLPLKVEGGLVTEMLIMRDQSMCCFGTAPKINEWVSVKMAEKGVRPVMDQPVTLFGKLFVGEMRENGYLVGIYRMDGDKMNVD